MVGTGCIRATQALTRGSVDDGLAVNVRALLGRVGSSGAEEEGEEDEEGTFQKLIQKTQYI